MTVYEVTLLIDSDTRTERLRETLDRIVEHTFGSSGHVDNFLEIDDEYEEDHRCCHCQCIDDHNEGVARSAGAQSYIRTDGHRITFSSHPIDLEED